MNCVVYKSLIYFSFYTSQKKFQKRIGGGVNFSGPWTWGQWCKKLYLLPGTQWPHNKHLLKCTVFNSALYFLSVLFFSLHFFHGCFAQENIDKLIQEFLFRSHCNVLWYLNSWVQYEDLVMVLLVKRKVNCSELDFRESIP